MSVTSLVTTELRDISVLVLVLEGPVFLVLVMELLVGLLVRTSALVLVRDEEVI